MFEIIDNYYNYLLNEKLVTPQQLVDGIQEVQKIHKKSQMYNQSCLIKVVLFKRVLNYKSTLLIWLKLLIYKIL